MRPVFGSMAPIELGASAASPRGASRRASVTPSATGGDEQRRGAERHQRAADAPRRERPPRGGRLERLVLSEDPALEFLEPAARLEPEVLGERPLDVAVHGERVCLPTRAIADPSDRGRA
jgi:hypothetical protein